MMMDLDQAGWRRSSARTRMRHMCNVRLVSPSGGPDFRPGTGEARPTNYTIYQSLFAKLARPYRCGRKRSKTRRHANKVGAERFARGRLISLKRPELARRADKPHRASSVYLTLIGSQVANSCHAGLTAEFVCSPLQFKPSMRGM